MSCCCCCRRRRRRNNGDSAGEIYTSLSLPFCWNLFFSFSAHGTSIWWPERFAEKLGPQSSCLSGSAVDFLDCVNCITSCLLVMFIIIFIAHRTVEELVEELAGCTYLKLDFPPPPRLELRRCLLLLLLLFLGEWQQPRLVCRDPISQSSFWASVSFRESLDTPVWFARGCLSTREGDIPSRLLLN